MHVQCLQHSDTPLLKLFKLLARLTLEGRWLAVARRPVSPSRVPGSRRPPTDDMRVETSCGCRWDLFVSGSPDEGFPSGYATHSSRRLPRRKKGG